MRKIITNPHYVNILKMFIQNNYKHNYRMNCFTLFIQGEEFSLYISPRLYQKIILLKSRSALTKGDNYGWRKEIL